MNPENNCKPLSTSVTGKLKPKRQANQHRLINLPWELSEGAEKLLNLIRKYQNTYNVTTTQYANLMGIERRNLVNYIRELEYKGRIEVFPHNKKRGRGRGNTYRVLEFNSKDWCIKNGFDYEALTSDI